MSKELKKIEEPSIGLHLAIGLASGTGSCMLISPLNRFLIENALVESINLIKFLMIMKLLAPSLGVFIAQLVYRHKFKLYMRSTFTEDIPTDF